MNNRFFSNLTHFFQSTCLLCHCPNIDQSHFGVCAYCLSGISFIQHSCNRCGIHLHNDHLLCSECINFPPSFDFTCAALSYEEILPSIIYKFKRRHDNAIRRFLAELFIHKLKSSPLPKIDYIIPTPMHWQRNLDRKNNHAYLLAKTISQELQLPLSNKIIIKKHHKPSQKNLGASDRKMNLGKAFQCINKIDGLKIAVIDDVMTTGSTMNEIARTLKNAGANEVHCWIIARTPKYA